MQVNFLIFLFLLETCSYSQTLQGYVRDKESQEIVSSANFSFKKNKFITSSNSNGFYKINLKNNLSDTLQVSFLGYETKYIELKKFSEDKIYNLDIYLDETPLNINKLTINSEKYNKKYVLGEKRNGNISNFVIIGFEQATWIENPFKTDGILKSINLHLKKRPKSDFTALLKIRTFSYDKKQNIPSEKSLSEEIIIYPKNKNYKLKIDVEKLKIPFPKEGICVSVELIDQNKESKYKYKIAPGFRYTYKENKSLTWMRFQQGKWGTGYLNNKENKGNLMIGLDVLMRE